MPDIAANCEFCELAAAWDYVLLAGLVVGLLVAARIVYAVTGLIMPDPP